MKKTLGKNKSLASLGAIVYVAASLIVPGFQTVAHADMGIPVDVSALSAKPGVPVLSNLPVDPEIIVRVGNEIYFSGKTDSAKSSEPCVGKDLYSGRFGEGPAKKILDVACVLSLQTDGKNLFVEVFEKNESNIKQLVKGESGKEELSQKFGLFYRQFPTLVLNLRRNQLGDLNFKRWTISSIGPDAALFTVLDAKNKKDQGVGEYLAYFGVDTKEIPPLFGKVTFDNFKLGFSGNLMMPDRETMLISNSGNMGGIFVSHRDNETRQWTQIEKVGGDSVLVDDWQEVDVSSWNVRNPKYVTLADEGVIVANRSSLPGERLDISYVSLKTKKAERIEVPSSDVSGIYWDGKGLFVAKSLSREIIYFGDLSNIPVEIKNESTEVALAGVIEGCDGDLSLRKSGTRVEVVELKDGEYVSLANLPNTGEGQFVCLEGALAVLTKEIDLDLRHGHLRLVNKQVKDPETGKLTEIELGKELGLEVPEINGLVAKNNSFLGLSETEAQLKFSANTLLMFKKGQELFEAQRGFTDEPFGRLEKSEGGFFIHLENSDEGLYLVFNSNGFVEARSTQQ